MVAELVQPVFDWGKELVDLVADLVCVCREGRVAFINAGGARMLGADPRALVGRPFIEFLHPDSTGGGDLAVLVRATAPTTLTMVHGSGAPFRVSVRARKSRGAPGTVLVYARDLTGTARTAESLRGREPPPLAVLDPLAEAVVIADGWGTIASVNRAAEVLFGYPADEIGGRPLSYLIPGCDLTSPGIGRAMVGLRRDGSRFPLDVMLTEVTYQGERMRVATIRDTGGRLEADDKLRLAEAVFENADEGIVVCDGDWMVSAVNPAFCDLTGLAMDEFPGPPPPFLAEGDTVQAMRAALEQDGRWRGELWTANRDGESQVLGVAATAILGDGRTPRLFSLLVTDVTERARATDMGDYGTGHDSVSGLPNRALLLDRLAQTLAAASRTGQKVGLMSIRLAGVRRLRDTLGLEAGNQVVKEVAARLSTCMRPYDTVARFGEDVFMVMMPAIEAPHHIAIVAKRMLARLSRPIVLGSSGSRRVEAGIGIAVYPDDGPDVDTLLQGAETAMRNAGARGESAFEFYDGALNHEIETRIALWHALAQALEHHEFELHWQPRVEITTDKVTAIEAVLRWRNRSLGAIEPRTFIQAIEDSGHMEAVGAWIIDTACRQQAEWTAQRLVDFRISINLSDRQLRQGSFVTGFRDALSRTNADPARFEVEITEDMLARDTVSCVATLWQLRELGVSIVLDDFGTGDASLTRLRHFPIQVVKIDPSLTAGVAGPGREADTIAAIIGMTHALGLKVVAESVETEDQLERLRHLGCDEAQGFLFCRPLSAADLTARLEVCVP
ncbi:MAG: EAL domain-containing protein [Alphaproteobacteria bacterium]